MCLFSQSSLNMSVCNPIVKKKELVTRRFEIEFIDKNAEAHVIHQKNVSIANKTEEKITHTLIYICSH